MSRVGRKPIEIPAGVDISIEGRRIKVKGPKGELEFDYPDPIEVRRGESELLVERPNDERKIRSLHGTTRAIIANMVHGVTAGFERKLDINGVGYRASVQGDVLNLELGYSHPVPFNLPQGVSAKVEGNTHITISGIDKQVLGQTAAEIREIRPPEPYKGKGVKYAEEQIRRKVGKKNA